MTWKSRNTTLDHFSKVDLDIVGCPDLNGGAASSPVDRGWDYGVFAQAVFGEGYDDSARLNDYGARFFISISGTDIHHFRENGIYAATGDENAGFQGHDLRGQLEIIGGTKVRHTGAHLAGSGTNDTGNGIQLASGEGYLSFEALSSEVTDNAQSGICALAQGTDPNDQSIWPNGLWLGIRDTEIQDNLAHGVEAVAAAGSIGSTWHYISFYRQVYTEPIDLEDYPSESGVLKYGLGYIDRCSINNNGSEGTGDGVRVQISSGSHAGLPVTNSVVWNNAGYGINFGSGGKHFSSVVHSTVVGNDGGFNMEVQNQSMLKVWRSDPGAIPEEIRMGIYNCIFQMENSMALDFGPDLAATLALDDTIRSSDILVYGGGTRVWRSSPQDPWDNAQSNTESAAPFLGPINYSSNNPAQFFLDPGPPTDPDFDNNTFPGLGTSGIDGLVEIDFSGSNRPVVLSERDKGAEELP